MDQNEAVLTMKQVRVRRGSFLLQDIDLEVGRREIFAVLGKTGAGKSVLLETAAGFHTPERGEVYLHGQELQSYRSTKEISGICIRTTAFSRI